MISEYVIRKAANAFEAERNKNPGEFSRYLRSPASDTDAIAPMIRAAVEIALAELGVKQ